MIWVLVLAQFGTYNIIVPNEARYPTEAGCRRAAEEIAHNYPGQLYGFCKPAEGKE